MKRDHIILLLPNFILNGNIIKCKRSINAPFYNSYYSIVKKVIDKCKLMSLMRNNQFYDCTPLYYCAWSNSS